jgi:hypothetical protein
MNKLLVIVLCVAMPLMVFAADNGYKVTYDGGSIPDAKAGNGMKLFIESTEVRLVGDKGGVLTAKMSTEESGRRLGLRWFPSESAH